MNFFFKIRRLRSRKFQGNGTFEFCSNGTLQLVYALLLSANGMGHVVFFHWYCQANEKARSAEKFYVHGNLLIKKEDKKCFALDFPCFA